jgi:hypothetical protein
MSKPSDRLFHLIVSVFALTLTVVSGMTVLYQRHPDEVRSWMKPLQQAPWLSRLSGMNLFNDVAQPAGPSQGHTSPVTPATQTGNSTPFIAADNASLVRLTAYGSDVPAGELQSAKDLLTKYAIPDVISKSIRMNLSKPVQVYIAQNATDYKNVLSFLGLSVSEAQRFSQDTGGFTQGNDIVIPLYQNKTTADLANTLAHELTHAFLNANVGDTLPSWVNEGTAVMLGMEFQQLTSDSEVSYEGYARQMEESVLDATRADKLIPLTGDESKVLAGDADYDLELQDWLAVRALVQDHGLNGLASYLGRLAQNMPESKAFTQTFGQSSDTFNAKFTNLLKQSADVQDGGVQVTMQVPSTYKGLVRVLQHGSQNWVGFRPAPGSLSFTLSPSGDLSGQAPIHTVMDSSPPDGTTTYIDLDSDSALTYNGQAVSNCGFAIDYHYGTYAFVNAWITDKDGKSVYIQEPKLFGITLTNVKETAPNSVLLGFLTTPKPS